MEAENSDYSDYTGTPTKLYTDFSRNGLGGALFEGDKLVGLMSKVTTPEQSQYSAVKGEAYALQSAYQTFKPMMPTLGHLYRSEVSR